MRKNIITRTINNYACDCIFFVDDSIKHETVFVPTQYNAAEKAEKYLRKHATDGKKLVAVTAITERAELRGMYESDFIKLARKAEARSPETRNCVTKEISLYTAVVMLVKKDNTVTSDKVDLPTGINTAEKVERLFRKNKNLIPDGWYFVKVNSITATTAIYFMTESEFINNSFPMKDRVNIG